MPQLESDMIPTPYLPEPGQKAALSDQVSEIGDDVWDGVQVQDVLKAWLNLLSSEGRYEDELPRQTDTLQNPIVRLAPALILRRRTERNQLLKYQRSPPSHPGQVTRVFVPIQWSIRGFWSRGLWNSCSHPRLNNTTR